MGKSSIIFLAKNFHHAGLREKSFNILLCWLLLITWQTRNSGVNFENATLSSSRGRFEKKRGQKLNVNIYHLKFISLSRYSYYQ
jgi:hypothetical protein